MTGMPGNALFSEEMAGPRMHYDGLIDFVTDLP
jgi:hypothetical protein